MLRQNTSVATLAIVTLVMVATVLLGTLGVINYAMESRDARTTLEAETTMMANQMAAALALPVWNFDRPQIDKIIDVAMESPDVYAVIVQQRDVSAPGGMAVYTRMRDTQGKVSTASGAFSPVGLLVQERSIDAAGEPLGSVKMFVTTKVVEQRLRKSLLLLAGRIILFDLILIGSLYVLLRRIVLKPLKSVEQYASIVSSGGSHVPTIGPRRFSGEIESLRSSIEKMITLLDDRYTALQKNESMLFGVLDSVPHLIFWKDLNSVYVGGNQAFARGMGLSGPHEVAGKTDFDFWAATLAEEYRTADKAVIASAKPRRRIFKIPRPADGVEIYVEAIKIPLQDKDGKVTGVLGVYEDVSDRNRAEEELRSKEEQYRLLIEQNIVGIVIYEVILDPSETPIDYRLISANPAADHLTGLDLRGSIGQTSADLGWVWPEELKRKLMSLACTGQEMRYERYNESLGRFYEVSAFSPKPGQFALIFNDVTERKRAEAVLLESEKMRTIAGLSAGMAHEINNPLAGILQSSQVILNRVSPELAANRQAAEQCGTTIELIHEYMKRRGVEGMLEAIRTSGERAAGIVANMLSFSRKSSTEMRPVNLSSLLEKTLELAKNDFDLRRDLDLRHIPIQSDFATDLPNVECQETEIQQVILNLLKNGAQVLAQAGTQNGNPHIVLRTRLEGQTARIEVEDNGPGMSEDVRRRVFEPFFTTKRAGEGTGLGLSVSYFIITENHSGAMSVESSPGKGRKIHYSIAPAAEGVGVRMRLRDLTIKSKMYGLTILSTAGLLIVLCLSIWCMATFRVNGPVYLDIVQHKDVVADILPPPLYIVEAYLVLQQVDDLADNSHLKDFEERFARLEQDYHRRYDHWKAALPDSDVKQTLIDQSSEPALRFFQIAREEYFPAREKGDRAAASVILRTKLKDAYEAHRVLIEKTVDLATHGAASAEEESATRVNFWMRAMLDISIISVVGLALMSWLVTRSILRSTGVLIERVEEMARRDGDLTARVNIESRDEMGRLANGINATIAKMQAIVHHTREVERESTHLRHLLRNIIDSMPSMLVGVDPDARITEWNREAERVTGISENAAIGKALLDIFPQLTDQMDMVFKAVRERVVQKGERIPLGMQDGQHFNDMTVYPLIANGVKGAVLRIDDVTTRVRLEEMMIQSEKMLSVGGLAAGMAHEINNPLAGMLQNAQVIINRISPELAPNRLAAEESGTTVEAIHAYMQKRGIVEMLQDIRSSGERAAEIVANMLGFCRRGEPEMELHSLADLLDRTVELAYSDYDLKKRYDFKSIELVREFDASLPATPCRAGEIQQVILNLLQNAAQAMLDRGNRSDGPRIVLRISRDGDFARIEVEDNGPGIPESIRRRIFEPFFTTRDPQSGTGLGLFVSYFIITNNHGGRFTVESRVGEGTKFCITIPIRLEM